MTERTFKVKRNFLNFRLVDNFINGAYAVIYITTKRKTLPYKVTQGHKQWCQAYWLQGLQ